MLMGRTPAYEIPCLDLECGKSVTHAFGKGSKEKITLPDRWEVKNINKYVTDLKRS